MTKANYGLTRRALLKIAAALSAGIASAEVPTDPWPADRLIEPAALAESLKSDQKSPVLISVVFPVLYRQRHIARSQLAGPGSKPEGIAELKTAVSSLPKNAAIVIYCGCCPMEHCPNIRPAYSTLADLGYTNVQVLHLRTNLRTDWTDQGYPVEPKPEKSNF